ncbi:cupin domain-containing protein [Falsiroseomonas selenitidurans]|uniref:Phosphoribosylaminoimidazole carboxylase n=1 Tax=Falsiroseomonas selenitidurans TaxID=2716335 RepID=A0ABX1E6C1_9PROT|nr:cupin domain-containing protein [Falsiroseomonas selenitidurans]NKC32744.1 phosphoribosylaminoimidazole carboxylase [Falsiroseomonas selenitidurans]
MTPRFGSLTQGETPAPGAEHIATLLAEGGVVVERIASHRAASAEGFWYDQEGTEFVLLLRGTAVLAFAAGPPRTMAAGDWAVLPAHCRHRVAETSAEALWLAVHLPPG